MQSLAEAYTCPSKGIGSPTRCTIPPKQRESNVKRTDELRKRERERKRARQKIRRKRKRERETGEKERTKAKR